MKVLTERKNYKHLSTDHTDFGMKDKTGRALGCVAWLGEFDLVALPEGTTCGCVAAPGHYFTAEVRGTRNGKAFGAISVSYTGTSREEAEAYITRRIEVARKTATKNAAP